MNLTSMPTIKTAYSVDDNNVLTIDFIDPSTLTSVGTISIENIKYKALIRALDIIASERVSMFDIQIGHRTMYRKQDEEAETIFV